MVPTFSTVSFLRLVSSNKASTANLQANVVNCKGHETTVASLYRTSLNHDHQYSLLLPDDFSATYLPLFGGSN